MTTSSLSLEDLTIAAINDFTPFSCSDGTTDDTSNIMYDSSSKKKGNFLAYFARAQGDFTQDCLKYSIGESALTDDQKAKAYAFLCQIYQEQKRLNWGVTSKSKSEAGSSISYTRSKPTTDGQLSYAAYIRTLKQIGQTGATTTLDRHTDDTNYPQQFRDSQLRSIEIEQK
jgi:hypothetical protein